MHQLFVNKKKPPVDLPVLKTSRQIKVRAVVESTSTEEFLHGHTRMFHGRISSMEVIKAIIIGIICRKIVDTVQNKIVIVGLVYAI
jgi:hypothetical protein